MLGAERYGFAPIFCHVDVHTESSQSGNRKLEKPRFHKTAAEGNFFLRGFNHLLIFKKEDTHSGK